MITAEQIKEILSLYKKHGWDISRVLLSAELKNSLSDVETTKLFDDAEIVDSKADGVWFSRPSKHNRTAWELRHLGERPFAIIEVFDKDTDENEQQETLNKAENRLKEYASNLIDSKNS